MTVSSTLSRTAPFAGNDVATSFAFTFKTYAKADLLVQKVSTAGVVSTLVLDSSYSVSLNADQNVSPGGSITYPISGAPLATGETLTISSNASDLQQTTLPNGGAFNALVVSDMVDYRTIVSHQNRDAISRSIKAPVVDPLTVSMDLPIVSLRASKVLGFDANGNPSVYSSSSAVTDAGSVNFLASGTGARSRTVQGKLRDVVDIKDFGAIADGGLHPLSERYATLGAAQVDYPHAVALTDQIDWAATRAAIKSVNPLTTGTTEAGARLYGGTVFASKGKYVFNRNIPLPSQVVLEGQGGLAMFSYDFAAGTSTIPGTVFYYVPTDATVAAFSISGYHVAASDGYTAGESIATNNRSVGGTAADVIDYSTGIAGGTYVATQGCGLRNLAIVGAGASPTSRMGLQAFAAMTVDLQNVLIANFKSGARFRASWGSSIEGIYIRDFDTVGLHYFDSAESVSMRKGWIHGGVSTGNTALELGYVNANIHGFQFELADVGVSIVGAFVVLNITASFEIRNKCILLTHQGGFATSAKINAIDCEAQGIGGNTVFLDSDATAQDCDVLIDNLNFGAGMKTVTTANLSGAGNRIRIENTPINADDLVVLAAISRVTPLTWRSDPVTLYLPGVAEVEHNVKMMNAASTLRVNHFFAGAGQWYTVAAQHVAEYRDFNTGNLLFRLNMSSPYGIEFAFGSKIFNCFGTPEAQITAPVGSICMRNDGGAGTSFYVKESGAGNVGWVGK